MNPKSGRRRSFLWYLLGAAWLAALVLGVIGFGHYAALHNQTASFWDDLYLTFQLIPMNSGAVEPPIPLELDLARFFIPGLTLAAAANAVLGLFCQQIQIFRLRSLSGHIIVCGLSHKGFLLASSFRAQGDAVVVIEQNEENDWIESCREQGITVLFGDAADPVLLGLAGVERARGLFAVCDDDGVNAEIALHAQELTRHRKGEPLVCLAHVAVPSLYALMHERETMLESTPFRLELFNVFERGARRLLQEHPAWDPDHLPPGGVPHLLLVGLGRLGEALILHAARDWWDQHTEHKLRLRITIIDRAASTKVESLNIRYPQIGRACELIPLVMDIHSPAFERAAFLFDGAGKPSVNAVYILVDDDSLGLHAGLVLMRQMPAHEAPIVIRMAGEKGLSRLLKERQNHQDQYRNMFAFGLLDSTCTPSLLHSTQRDILARSVHEEYIAQHKKAGTFGESEAALQPWEQLDEAYRKPNYRFVDHIKTLLESVGCGITHLVDWDAPTQALADPDVEHMARLEHQLWKTEKTAEGWRYAPGPKDPDAKTNPDLVAWEKMSGPEKEKNRQFIRGIPSFLGRAGYQIKKNSGIS